MALKLKIMKKTQKTLLSSVSTSSSSSTSAWIKIWTDIYCGVSVEKKSLKGLDLSTHTYTTEDMN
jgi:hypothetical protein